MSSVIGGLFNFSDRLQMQSLGLRGKRNEVVTANIANAETPGFRAFGFDFEKQLQSLGDDNVRSTMRTSDPRHVKNAFTQANGQVTPDVYVRPTESVDEDGNTVDIDKEMSEMARNQILYRTTVETLNRKIGMLKYAINGGR
ncbi:MAG: flagellar basal body rod protein FlgB [Proteobacteria bacterium]|nr:flagellar basal body rod protein FlgB [Pseudomonadota bacterium]